MFVFEWVSRFPEIGCSVSSARGRVISGQGLQSLNYEKQDRIRCRCGVVDDKAACVRVYLNNGGCLRALFGAWEPADPGDRSDDESVNTAGGERRDGPILLAGIPLGARQQQLDSKLLEDFLDLTNHLTHG